MRLIKILLFSVLVVNLTGCSVGMALTGKKEPKVSELQIGMTRYEAHVILRNHAPALTYLDGIKSIEEFTIEMNSAPSNYRAVYNIIMDILTLGLWELLGTPLEGFTPAHKTLKITYIDEKIVEIRRIGAWRENN